MQVLRAVGIGALGVAAVVVIEALLASRRAVLLDPPAAGSTEFGDASSPVLRLAVVGDSTAVGVGASHAGAAYPSLVAQRLGHDFHVQLDVIGRPGARMSDAASLLAPDAAALRPHIAIVGIGANDVTHLTPLRRVARDLEEVIEVLRASGAAVLVALGPRFDTPLLAQPFRALARARARSLNRTIRRVAEGRGAEVLDMPEGIGRAFARDPGRYYSDDGFHPSDLGYLLWAGAMEYQVIATAKRVGVGRS